MKRFAVFVIAFIVLFSAGCSPLQYSGSRSSTVSTQNHNTAKDGQNKSTFSTISTVVLYQDEQTTELNAKDVRIQNLLDYLCEARNTNNLVWTQGAVDFEWMSSIESETPRLEIEFDNVVYGQGNMNFSSYNKIVITERWCTGVCYDETLPCCYEPGKCAIAFSLTDKAFLDSGFSNLLYYVGLIDISK